MKRRLIMLLFSLLCCLLWMGRSNVYAYEQENSNIGERVQKNGYYTLIVKDGETTLGQLRLRIQTPDSIELMPSNSADDTSYRYSIDPSSAPTNGVITVRHQTTSSRLDANRRYSLIDVNAEITPPAHFRYASAEADEYDRGSFYKAIHAKSNAESHLRHKTEETTQEVTFTISLYNTGNFTHTQDNGKYQRFYGLYTINIAKPERTVTWDPNGGTLTSADTTTVIDADTVTLPASPPEREHFNYIGWATTPDAKKPDVSEDTVVCGNNPTYYAVWLPEFIPVPPTIEVTNQPQSSYDAATVVLTQNYYKETLTTGKIKLTPDSKKQLKVKELSYVTLDGVVVPPDQYSIANDGTLTFHDDFLENHTVNDTGVIQVFYQVVLGSSLKTILKTETPVEGSTYAFDLKGESQFTSLDTPVDQESDKATVLFPLSASDFPDNKKLTYVTNAKVRHNGKIKLRKIIDHDVYEDLLENNLLMEQTDFTFHLKGTTEDGEEIDESKTVNMSLNEYNTSYDPTNVNSIPYVEVYFPQVPFGTYKVWEEENERYVLDSITEIVNATLVEDNEIGSCLNVVLNETNYESEVSATFKNITGSGSLKIIKYGDKNKTPLKDVTFSLQNKEDEEDVQYATTNEEGIAMFEEVQIGEYVLTEIRTADGHNLLKDKIPITMPLTIPDEKVEELHIDTSKGMHSASKHQWLFYDLTYEITNNERLVLPKTGSQWTWWLIAFIVAGCTILGYQFTRKKNIPVMADSDPKEEIPPILDKKE